MAQEETLPSATGGKSREQVGARGGGVAKDEVVETAYVSARRRTVHCGEVAHYARRFVRVLCSADEAFEFVELALQARERGRFSEIG